MEKTLFRQKECSIQIDNLLTRLFFYTSERDINQHLTSSLHTHSNTEIFACKSGKINIKTENDIFTLFAGDIAIVPAGIAHFKPTEADDDSESISIGIICAECSSKNNRDLYKRVSFLSDNKEIIIFKNQRDFFEKIQNITLSLSIESEPWLIIDFVCGISKLIAADTVYKSATKEKTKHKIKNIDRLIKLDYLINHEFMNPLSNYKIAEQLYISERQLSRLVLNHYGTTLHTLLMKKRMTVASKLLVEFSDSVENIALSVGFNSKMSFYREFKKMYGVTPAQYRNNAKEK